MWEQLTFRTVVENCQALWKRLKYFINILSKYWKETIKTKSSQII